MHLLSKRETVILSITIGVVLFSVFLNTALMPVLRSNDLLDKKIMAAKAKLIKYRRIISQKEKITGEYSKFFSGSLIQGKQEDASVAALYALENLAKEAQIRIIEIRPRGASEEAAVEKSTLFFIRAEGPMEGYLRFVYELENPFSLIRIKSFQLSAKTNTQSLEGNLVVSGEMPKGEAP